VSSGQRTDCSRVDLTQGLDSGSFQRLEGNRSSVGRPGSGPGHDIVVVIPVLCRGGGGAIRYELLSAPLG
jgi:hypothetical protein